MRKLTAQEIQDNWKKLMGTIEGFIDDDRKENLLKMYDYFQDRMMLAPASAKGHFHNAMPGGYVEHILHIVQYSIEIKRLWEKNGAMINFTDEELVFAALHHDLGKIGDLNYDYYIPQDSEWHRKNRGEIYKHNPQLQYMKVPDRGLWLLQHFGVKVTDKEYIGIKLTDGLYDEANKSYLMGYNPDFNLRSNMAYILHQADMMATHIEYDMWNKNDEEQETKQDEKLKEIKNEFNKLFA